MKSLKYLNKYFVKYKWRLLLGTLITVLAKILTLKIPDFVGNSLNIVEDYQLGNATTLSEVKTVLFKNIMLIIGVTLLGGFFTFFMRQTIIVTSRMIEFDLKNEIYQQYQRLSTNFYKKNRTGDLMNRISEDVSKVRMYFGPAVMYTLNMIISLIVGFSQMYEISPTLTLYTMIPFPILSVSIFVLSKQINKRSTVVQEYLSKLTTFNQEFFSGINVVKSYAIEQEVIASFDEIANKSKDKNIELHKVQALFFPLMILLIGISNSIVLYIGGQQYIAGEIQLGAIAAFVMYVNILTWPVAVVGWVTSTVQQAAASQERINEFLEQVPEIRNNTDTATEIQGKIEFKDVCLTYDDTNITALNNVNLVIEKGETLAILGTTGSGKSTIINLIARLYDVSKGAVLIDGKNIKDCNLYDVRNQIGFVPQDPFLFSDSLENNIKFGKENATKQEIIQAAKNAVIHDNIINFKNGYQTVLGERGVTLSGGQKQRTAISRAIIKTPKILIFDDCLSAVDTETEQQILSNLDRISKDKTSIIISHSVSSVKNADKIIVLDAGKVIQQGVHNQLIKVAGYYKELYEQQLLEKEM
ncbi:ABC transporter ATP-binding protein [Tenacibaculum finnmarkense]|uniref:ATP-binding cassette domain-containing protein n=1 Tax=Tenacibaculum finnmarkense genomovar finnmarkense TaxID=1458503 RepID=A0AAP1RF70_9FLAO|nr:ABC transporter ATP-binding protein [Tenacibaculum finnmarkense]MBE7652909.1 ATP-binding cassette domain-containing protein [Tenacibaculum finnmarkense genomovar finnmarkense]MBE7695210.1 ATP-binding cassette domain-containing protein [Tenacibaculum finnmarkense genomovar finnmarkense]MCD8427417.1 ABC transporter ATP-binding protein/permease [Tenacibaculum finnmarkense genomovar finnmarkense]MCG8769775.1 ABC transporter ATP-binding protein [Tenacibaculum finnmarkense]MCG8774804.1 ABC transp